MPGSAAVIELGRAERNKRDKRERLIRAARELFRTRGFDQTTTSEIAQLADVAKGTLFFHAGSKEELLVMMFQKDVGRAIDRAFATVRGATFLDQVLHVFGVMLEQNRREIRLARIFVKELAFVKGDRHGIDVVMETFFRQMIKLIESAQERGEISKSVDPALLAYNLFALYYVFILLWLGGGERSPDGQRPTLRQMLELALSGLTRPPSSRRYRNLSEKA